MNNSTTLVWASVTHFPGPQFADRLQWAKEMGFQTWVYDNTPGATSLPINVDRLFQKGLNDGIGMALHTLLSCAYDQGFQWLWYVDQDTQFDKESLLAVKEYASSCVQPYPAVAQATQERPKSKVELAINSGSLFHLPHSAHIGWHNRDWFLEGVDYEYCLRADRRGLNLVQFHCPGFDHHAEQPKHNLHTKWNRMYSLGRTLNFEWALFKLCLSALAHAQWNYAYLFVRNMITHFISQLAVWAQRTFMR